MENTAVEQQQIQISKIKTLIKEGIKTGLFAFIICYGVSLILSIVLHFTAMEFVESAVLGAMGENNSTIVGTIIKLTSILLSLSLFNSHGAIKIGLIIFIGIPLASFYVVGNKEKMKKGFNQWQLVTYFFSSFIFTIVLTLLQLVTKGEFLGVEISFLSFKNFIITLFVTLLLQMIIGLNYNRRARSYIRATRVLFRLVLGLGTIFALIDLIKLVIKLPIGVFGRIGGVIGLLPNMAVYKSFLFMGNDIETSESLTKWMEKAADIHTFDGLSLWMSLVAIIVWILLVLFSLLYINKNKYWVELGLFSFTFSVVSLFLAYCTSTTLGKVILVGEISIGLNLLQAFLVPFLSILALGLMLWLIRKMIAIIKEI